MKTIKEFVVYPHKVQMALCQYIRYERLDIITHKDMLQN